MCNVLDELLIGFLLVANDGYIEDCYPSSSSVVYLRHLRHIATHRSGSDWDSRRQIFSPTLVLKQILFTKPLNLGI